MTFTKHHDPDDLSVWRAIRVALGLAPRPDMTPTGHLRRARAQLSGRT